MPELDGGSSGLADPEHSADRKKLTVAMPLGAIAMIEKWATVRDVSPNQILNEAVSLYNRIMQFRIDGNKLLVKENGQIREIQFEDSLEDLLRETEEPSE